MNLDEVTIENLRLWSADALKHFLSVRKKSVCGTFDELVARVFAAHEDNIPVDAEAEKVEKRLFTEYKQKLQQDGITYPDPTTIEEGWLSEKDGMFEWPSIYFNDIASYLNQTCSKKQDLAKRLLNEYKEGKAYRYYACEWVKDVQYHTVRPSSSVAFLKADIYPSMSVRKKPYKAWVMVVKKTDNTPGGDIKTAYCTCPAGLLGTCNHIAGLLFRVESAVRTGATERSSTEKLCAWVVPRSGVSIKPGKWRDTYAIKDKYSQMTSREEREGIIKDIRNFKPFGKAESEKLEDLDTIAKELYDDIVKVAPECVFALTMGKKKPTAPQKPDLPDHIQSCAADCTSVDELIEAIQLKEEDINNIELCTRAQSHSPEWQQYRIGRITSSTFYSVHTKTQTLLKQVEANKAKIAKCDWLVDKIMGREKSLTILPVKHGIALEPRAKHSYKKLQKLEHKKFQTRDCGLVISKLHPFLATSPDLIVTCECHGKRLCEIKCPFTIRGQRPTVENVPYLLTENGEVCLAKKCAYYGQIQGQLALTNCLHCDLFIFTEHGHLLIPVKFDESFWQSMLSNLIWFWTKQIAPELLKRQLQPCTKRSLETDDADEQSGTKRPCLPCTSGSNFPQQEPSFQPKQVVRLAKPRAGRGKQAAKFIKLQVYLCGLCGKDIDEHPQTYVDSSIKCDLCPEWYHQMCVGFDESSEITADDEWVCYKCT